MSTPQDRAEAFAKKMIQDRGNPHWHDMRDCYLAGAQSREERIRELLNQLEETDKAHATLYREKQAWKQLAEDASEINWEVYNESDSMGSASAWLVKLADLKEKHKGSVKIPEGTL